MKKDLTKLQKIYKKTDGYCHLCHKKLTFGNYGKGKATSGWQIEHSRPKAKGGTDHLNNLFPACVSCNKEKGTMHTLTVRKRNGVTRAPYNKNKKKRIQRRNSTTGAFFGGLIGSLGGPIGTIVGATIGSIIGNESSPKV